MNITDLQIIKIRQVNTQQVDNDKTMYTSKRLQSITNITCKQCFGAMALWVPVIICSLLPLLVLGLQLQETYKFWILTIDLQNCENNSTF